MDKINFIQPAVFGDQIEAFFTLKNRDYESNGEINGLNLGYNTDDNREVITQNRAFLLKQTGINNIVYAQQTHGRNVKFVEEPETVKNCDALITQRADLALAIRVADCAAVLLYEPQTDMIAAVHAGWRGAAANIIPSVLEQMKRKGAVLTTAQAYISPCICGKHFEVGAEVAEQFPAQFVEYEQFAKPHVDLKRFIKYQLKSHNIKEPNIELDRGCTIENEQHFYSYRREKEKSGRMLAVIKLK